MTLEQLKQEVAKLKKISTPCNLFDETLQAPVNFPDPGVFVKHYGSVWEVYHCERCVGWLVGTFYTESDLCEYILCYYKRENDQRRWF